MDTVAAHVPALFYVCALVASFYFLYNLRRAFAPLIGRPDNRSLRWWEVISNAVYFGLGQRRVNSRRFLYPTLMHLLLGWGFLELLFATTVDFLVERNLLLTYLPTKDTVWFAALNELGGLALLAGVGMALMRRRVTQKPELLPHDSWTGRNTLLGDTGILVVLLLLGVGGFLAEAARLVVEQPAAAGASFVAYGITFVIPDELLLSSQSFLWWSHAILALVFIALIPQTKLFHAIISTVNVALTNQREHGNLRHMGIAKLMEDPNADLESLVLGVGKIADFTWKQLLDSAACTECARCTSVCPANSVGLPLSPMKIIQGMRHAMYAESLHDRESTDLIGALITPLELWSCTTCRACMEECPVLIDHIPAIVDMRRHLVLSEGLPPADAAPTLEKTTLQGNPWGFPRVDRLKWATDAGLNVPVMADKKQAEVLYWVGCAGAYDPRNQKVAKAMISIFEQAGVDFAVLGVEESCTGDAARRMGEEYVFETLAAQNLATLGKYDFKRIVTTCPHCLQTLGDDYTELGGNFEVVHHTTFVEELISSGALTVDDGLTGKITYHDPCYLGRHQGIYDAPRTVLAELAGGNGNFVEMDQFQSSSFCCGAGGGNMWYELKEGERINMARMNQALETGAETIATACSFCTIMLDDALKVGGHEEDVAVLDIVELVVANMQTVED
ncbi:(Fe-S)-binding protein [Candidatus Neomarinimicrobiota bacterium]